MKFKVGDRVRVRQDLVIGREYGDAIFTEKMAQFAGKMVTIKGGFETSYIHWSKIKEDEMNGDWSDEMFEKVEFTKSDLKNGMVVEYRNGKRRVVVEDKVIDEYGHMLISDFNDAFEHCCLGDGCAIDKVYKSKAGYLSAYFDDENLELIWERNPAKKMTIAEIEKELGYKIEIVDTKY